MKLGCCLLASDLNPDYLDFYPLVHDAWQQVVGIDVRLVLIADEIPPNLHAYKQSITLFTPLPGVHTAFQAQCIRVLYPALMGSEYADAILISDMDMLPMSRRYFAGTIRNIDTDSFVVYRAGVLERKGQLPIMYNAALASTWGEMFPGLRDEGDVREVLMQWWSEAPDYAVKTWVETPVYTGPSAGSDWATDQTRLFSAVARWTVAAGEARLARLDDADTRFRRLDRHDLTDLEKIIMQRAHLLRAGYFTDYHMPQPPSEHAPLNAEAAKQVITPPSAIDRLRLFLKARV